MNEIKSTRSVSSTNTTFNALSYMIETKIKGMINTAIPVRVDSVFDGYVSATPLITQTDADGNSLPPVEIPKLPYVRVHGGVCAVIIDPIPGDIGIAIFAQQDISVLKKEQTTPVQPGSFRNFDMSDGVYLGGILNKEPDVYAEFKQNGEINIVAPVKVTVTSPDVVVNAENSATVNTNSCIVNSSTIDMKGETTITGNVLVNGNTTVSGSLTMGVGSGTASEIKGNVLVRGSLSSTGNISATNVTASGVTLTGHVHGGVQGGASTTGGPQG